VAQMTIFLPITEKDALLFLADREFRDPRKQAALLIRESLERRGLLPSNDASDTSNQPAPAKGLG
jgi:hypothetical protein